MVMPLRQRVQHWASVFYCDDTPDTTTTGWLVQRNSEAGWLAGEVVDGGWMDGIRVFLHRGASRDIIQLRCNVLASQKAAVSG